jgi:4-cresol dehydrogenase (hydroxylating) flavoprotein subunit
VALSDALNAWRKLLGEAHVQTESSPVAAAQTATFATTQKIPGILFPGNRAEVQDCLRIANRHGVAVYPISSGKNWGYGSQVPNRDGCVLLNLSRLDRIVDFNEDLAYVTVEPGVTQQELFAFLQSRQSKLWMDATGSSPQCSLIGNTMERGFGHTPYGDHFANVCGLEVVLPTGECIHTGFGRFSNSAATPVYRWGAGPSLDGLFSQGNLGIVTQMTIWLMPAPECFEAFFFSVTTEAELAKVVDLLRPLRQDGTLRSAVHVGNGYKVLSSIQQYPWEAMGGKTPLSAEVLAQFARDWDFGAWNGSGGLYGTRAQVAEAKRLVIKALKGKVKRVRFMNAKTLVLMERFGGLYYKLTGLNLPEMLKIMKPVFGLMQGVPTDTALASTYWRKRMAIPADMHPDRDGCGLMWVAPVAPLSGEHAAKIRDLAYAVLAEHGFEPMISMTLLTERVLGCIITIAYDRGVAGEDERAQACYRKLQAQLHSAGYYSYRLGIQPKGEPEPELSYQQLLFDLKNTLDPQQILAPGRYLPDRQKSSAN